MKFVLRFSSSKGPLPFTLIELIAVIAIALLVTGFVIGRVGKIPAFISLDRKANELQMLFVQASRQALAQNRNVSVYYDEDKRLFNLPSPQQSFFPKEYFSCHVPETISIEFENTATDDNGKKSFTFYPDGSCDGEAFDLKLKGHCIRISISSLTGLVKAKEVSCDD